MIPLLEIPKIVDHYAPHFSSIFSDGEYEHFKKYLSGLILSENKSVEAINRLFVLDVKNQSSLNRFLTNSNYTVDQLNKERLSFLQSNESTKMKGSKRSGGVLAIDDTMLIHFGQSFDQIAKLYDHVSQSYVWAHNLVNLHYSDDLVDYPVFFRLWKPADLAYLEAGLLKAKVKINAKKQPLKEENPKKWKQYLIGLYRRHKNKKAVQQVYQDKIIIAQQLLKNFYRQYKDLDIPVSFDKWFTSPAFCKYISKKLGKYYVAGLKSDEKILLKGSSKIRISGFVDQLKKEHLDENQPPVFKKVSFKYKGQKLVQYAYFKTHHICGYGRQKLLITCQEKDLSAPVRVFMTNALHWYVHQVSRVGRHRWPVEVYHKEGKAEGLDQYQVRDFNAIEKHIAFVALVYSLLQHARYDDALLKELQVQLNKNIEGSLAYWRRASQAQALYLLIQWVELALNNGKSLEEIIQTVIPAFGLS